MEGSIQHAASKASEMPLARVWLLGTVLLEPVETLAFIWCETVLIETVLIGTVSASTSRSATEIT